MMILLLFLAKGLVLLSASAAFWLLLRNRSAVLRDRIWTLTFSALVVVILAPAFLPSWSVPVPVVERTEPALPTITTPVHSSLAEASDPAVVVLPARRETSSPVPLPDKDVLLGGFLVAWAVGALVLLLRTGIDLVVLSRISRNADLAGSRIQHIKRRCAERLESCKRISARLSDEVSVPLVIGGWKAAVVLLPVGAEEWSDQRLESVLMHELAHVQRRDPLVMIITAIACALHWINPLTWWAARRASVDREEACDMMVLSAGADRFEYAQDLLDTARVISRPSPMFVSAVSHMATLSNLRQRVEALLSDRRPVAKLGRKTSRATLIIAAAAVIPIACAKIAETSSAISFAGNDAVIAQLLDESSPADTRHRAAWQLGDFEDREAVAALTKTLGDTDPLLRGMSAWALGEIKDIASLPELIAAMQDEDAVAREMIIRAIGEMDDPAAIDPLIAAAKSDDDVHRAAAVRALSDLEWSIDAQYAVEAALKDASPLVRKSAVIALGESEIGYASVDALVPLLSDEAPAVRALTAHTLGIIGDPGAIDALIAASRDSNPEVRTWTVWALDEISLEGRR